MIKHFLSVEDLGKSEIEFLIERGNHYLENNNSEILKGKFLYNVFFEESTRTITSFQTAGMRLGASVINLNMKFTKERGNFVEDHLSIQLLNTILIVYLLRLYGNSLTEPKFFFSAPYEKKCLRTKC